MLHVPPISIATVLTFGVLMGVALMLSLLISMRHAYLAIGVLLFMASISIVIDYFQTVYNQWLLPLQWYRSELFGVFGLILALGLLPRIKMLSFARISLQAWALLAIALYAGLMRMYHVTANDGAMSMVLAVMSVLPIAIVIPALLNNLSDAHKLIRLIVWVGVVWTLAVAVQFTINSNLLLLGPGLRFTGLIGNCNQAATMLSVMTTCAAWLALNSPRGRKMFACIAAVFLIQLVWTGSRGGVGMFSLGLAAVLYGRMGRAVLMFPVIVVFFIGAFWALEAVGVNFRAERLLSTQNTRAEGWTSLLMSGIQNPIMGAGPEEIEASESSYLLGFASFGIGMLILTILLVLAGINQSLRLFRVRQHMPKEWRATIDLCIGHQVIFFAGAFFEGYIQSRVGVHPVMMIMLAGLGRFILDAAAQGSEEYVEYAEEPSELDAPQHAEGHFA